MTLDFRTIIRGRAPLRLGLAGGGTDLSPYCDQFGGAVLNTTIDRFSYAFVTPRNDGKVVFRAKDLGREEVLESAAQLPQASLLLHRGVYERMVRDHNAGIPISATITTTVDAPMGSGLDSSSARPGSQRFAGRPGLHHALHRAPREIALRLAWRADRRDRMLPTLCRSDPQLGGGPPAVWLELQTATGATSSAIDRPDLLRRSSK